MLACFSSFLFLYKWLEFPACFTNRYSVDYQHKEICYVRSLLIHTTNRIDWMKQIEHLNFTLFLTKTDDIIIIIQY